MSEHDPSLPSLTRPVTAARLAVLRQAEDAAGHCRQPIRLRGWQREHDPDTGEVIAAVDSSDQPCGYLLIPCGNRREQVCPPCSRLYKGDTYQVLIAGLRGGHGIPGTVAAHPAVFATLTAPSFGAVHRGAAKPGSHPPRCHPRRDRPVCEHGMPASCGQRHEDGDPLAGQPLCGDCFDYPGAVLFNSAVPALWDQTTHAIRRQLGEATGLSQRALRQQLCLSFGKVIEYQRRGLVHVHAVIRIDGPGGAGDPAPPWASASLLRAVVTDSVPGPAVTLPDPVKPGQLLTLAWGRQRDVRIVRRDIAGELDDHKVAAYVAKYAVKGTEQIGGIPVRIRNISDLDDWHVTPHVRRLITACWQLGHREEYQSLRLARWAHQLGYRGWFSTRSRRYSVTLGSRRDERRRARTTWIREHHGLPAAPGVITAEWHYAGQAGA
ncbi:MAG: replication initiator [Streptosporangiaceae bacterium]